MQVTKSISVLLLFSLWVAVAGCSDSGSSAVDTRDSGVLHISVDESFRPVIDAQIRVFESLNPAAKIIAHYKPEADCLRDFAVDSIRLIIATRGFTENEEAFIIDSLKIDPQKMAVAYDAIAVIVHPQSPDSLFTMEEIKTILTDSGKIKKIPVFDGNKATSTVRFVIDSVLGGMSLSKNVVAAKTSEGVIDYVARTPEAIGFIGVSWVGNPQDSVQRLSYLSRVKVASLEHPLVKDKFVTPAQYNIMYGRYPMIRQLIYIVKERHDGLAHGFANFLTTQSGQLIFNRAYLLPGRMKFGMREAVVNE